MAMRKIRVAVLAVAWVIATTAAAEPAYPSRPIRLIVPFGPNAAAEIVAKKLGERFGQPVITEARPGAETIIGTDAVAKAAPDGYTVLFCGASAMSVLPHTRKHLPYDPFGDFVHVAQLAYIPLMLAVGPSAPVASVAELVALARSRPGRLSYGEGTETAFVAAETFKRAAKIDILHVPYKLLGTATTDLLAGRIDMIFASLLPVIAYSRTQRLRVMAVTGNRRSPTLPDVPTMAEAGIPGFESSSAYGISAPRGTPPAVVKRWNDELAAVLALPDVAEKFIAIGIEPRFQTSEQFTAFLHAESDRQRELLARIGFKPE